MDAFLLETDRPEVIRAVRRTLTDAGIPHQTGLQSQSPPWVAFFVPWSELSRARQLIRLYLIEPPEPDPEPDEDEDRDDEDARLEHLPPDTTPARFPWGPVQAVAAVVLLHLALLFASVGGHAPFPELMRQGWLEKDRVPAEPWRLLTSVFLHSDLRHVLSNGVSMLVFGVPLLTYLGLGPTAGIYLLAGLGGATCAWLLAPPGSIIIGSSGAVAGLFGAWVVLALGRARRERQGWRGRVRSLGIALLVLPAFVSPTGTDGRSISVESHLGGMATGAAIGALLSSRLLARSTRGGPSGEPGSPTARPFS